MKPCIFCPNPRTRKRGEHIWDDWLNSENGKPIRRPGTVTVYGKDGVIVRQRPSDRLDVTSDVVCDRCNSTWMSDLSTEAKQRLEALIRRDTPTDFNDVDVLLITAFSFLKSAVLDWSTTEHNRVPCISRTACVSFRDSLTSLTYGDISFPDGLQVWIARYRPTKATDARYFNDEIRGRGPFKGYRILVLTYVVGYFMFQLTSPRWIKATRNRPPAPFFQIVGDLKSVPIWPGVSAAYWPPPAHVDSGTLDDFRQRFRRVSIPKFS